MKLTPQPVSKDRDSHQLLETFLEQASKVIFDKQQSFIWALTSILAEGHLLLEDVPGVGKTTFSQTLSQLLGLPYKRIQFTSDLLPGDIIGTQVYIDEKKEFKFFPGPLFSNFVLADELNRANPRTQSALLQAMEEGSVTVDGHQQILPQPFILVATQNPQTQTGTYPLPESQLDRFLMAFSLEPANRESEIKLIQGFSPRDELKNLKPLMTGVDLRSHQQNAQKIILSEKIAHYIGEILSFTRTGVREDSMPLSTRAGMGPGRTSKAHAYLSGRPRVLPEDVRSVIIPCLSHRLGGLTGIKKGKEFAEKILAEIPVPI